jgi:beta-galactosidase/beta-glucuronidase
MSVVERDISHPSIVTWVPVNESWGVQHISHDPAQQHFVQALYHLTKALDPTRPVVSNDGWEHTESTC